ncbi:MAG: membrane protein [Acidimicrobiia bacterium]
MSRFSPQAVLGLCIVAFGLLLTADNMGLVEADAVLRYWPLAIVAIGVAKLVQSEIGAGRLVGVGLIALGLALTFDEVWDYHIDFDRLWPLALVAIGSFIVYRALSGGGRPRDAAGVSSDQTMSEFAFWSGKVRRNASPAFRRADLTAIMGGVEIDLRGASTGGGDAVIDVFVWWGGIDITVPPDWAVSNQVMVIMGGADDSSSGTQDAKSRLIVRGFCIMGGVDINTGHGNKKQW